MIVKGALLALLLLLGFLPGSAIAQRKSPELSEETCKALKRLRSLCVTIWPPSPSPLDDKVVGRIVRIGDFDAVTKEDLELLPKLNPIRLLAIGHAGITDEELEVLKEVEGLQVVGLRGSDEPALGISDKTVSYLADNPHLVRLGVTGPLHGETLDGFRDLEDLRTLSLQDAFLTAEGMRQIGTLAQLEFLSLVHCHVTDGELKYLAGLKNLKRLVLSENPIKGPGLEVLGELPKLKWLGLTRCLLSDQGCAVFAQLNLETVELLMLSDNQIGDRTLKYLASAGLSKLTDLRLIGTDITDAGMKSVASFQSLERLSIGDTRVGGRGLAHLGRLPNFRGGVSMAYAGLTDENAEGLLELDKVVGLILSGNDISDATVQILGQMKQLKGLWIARTAITERGMKKLRAALPNCEIKDTGIGGDMTRRIMLKGWVLP